MKKQFEVKRIITLEGPQELSEEQALTHLRTQFPGFMIREVNVIEQISEALIKV